MQQRQRQRIGKTSMLWLHVTKCIPDSSFESFALQLRSMLLLLFTMDIGEWFCFARSLFIVFFFSVCYFSLASLFRFSLQITCSPLIHTRSGRAHTHTHLLLFCVLAPYLRCHPVWKINQSHALCVFNKEFACHIIQPSLFVCSVAVIAF